MNSLPFTASSDETAHHATGLGPVANIVFGVPDDEKATFAIDGVSDRRRVV